MKRLLFAAMLALAFAAPALINPAFVSPAWAGHSKDYDEGEAAYNKGDYATALRKFRPLAEQGDADAQFGLRVRFCILHFLR